MTNTTEIVSETTLTDLPAGIDARVISIEGDGVAVRRLMEMGVVPGASIRVIKSAPFGDPIEVKIRRYHLALRRNEASAVKVGV